MKKFNVYLILSCVIVLSLLPQVFQAQAAEYENIDSFSIHPANRYDTELTTSIETITVDNGVLKYYDVGLTGNSSASSRLLGSTDFYMKGRIKTPTSVEGSYNNFPVISSSEYKAYFKMETIRTVGNVIDNEDDNNGDGVAIGGTVVGPLSNYNLGGHNGIDLERSSSEYLNLGDDNDYTFGNNTHDEPFTISIWVKFETRTDGNEYYIVCKEDEGATPDQEYELMINTAGRLLFACYDNSTGGDRIGRRTGDDFINSGEIHHIVATYDGSGNSDGIKIYSNATRADSAYALSGSYTAMENTAAPLAVGARSDGTQFLDGVVDEFYLFNSALNASFISELYTNYTDGGLTNVEMQIGLKNTDETLNLNTPDLAILFNNRDTYSSNDCLVYYAFTDTSGTLRKQNFFNITKNTWVRFEIEIDILSSEFNFKLYYDNKTEISDSDKFFTEISSARPRIFDSYTVDCFYGNNFVSNGSIYWELDSLNCPFEEFAWSGYGSKPSNFYTSSEYGAEFWQPNNTVSFLDTYTITCPDFDSVTGTLFLNTNVTSEAATDNNTAQATVEIHAVTPSTGVLAKCFTIALQYHPYDDLGNFDQTYADPRLSVSIGASNDLAIREQFNNAAFESDVESDYTIYRTPNQHLVLQVAIGDITRSFDYDVSSYGEEFVIKHIWKTGVASGAGDVARYNLGVKRWDLIYRDLFGIFPGLPSGDIGNLGQGWNFFMQSARGTMDGIGRLLDPIKQILNYIPQIITLIGNVVSRLADIADSLTTIIANLTTVVSSLGTIITDIGTIIANTGAMVTDIDSIFNDVADIVGKVTGDFTTWLGKLPDILSNLQNLWSTISTIVTDVTAAIWAWVIANASSLMNPILAWLLTVLADIAGFIVDIGEWIWDTLVDPIFLGLTNLILDAIDWLIVILHWTREIYTFVLEYRFAIFCCVLIYVFVATAMDKTDHLTWIADVIERATSDLAGGISALGFRVYIPLGLVTLIGMIYFWAGGT